MRSCRARVNSHSVCCSNEEMTNRGCKKDFAGGRHVEGFERERCRVVLLLLFCGLT
jgi:hypothetical protein